MAKQKFAAVGAPVATGDDLYLTTDAISITPTLGAELLSNPSFTAWTGDNPDGWTVSGESGSDPMVTQVASGGGVGTGAARLFSSASHFQPRMFQTIFTRGSIYQLSLVVSAVAAGKISFDDGVILNLFSAPGTYQFTMQPTTGACFVRAGSIAPIDVTVDSASVRALTGTEQLFTHAVPYGDFSAALTMADTLYQGGVVFNWGNANNFMRLYLDRVNGKVYLVKRVSGTYTTVGSWSATYSAGATLTARRHKDGTLDVIYNGVTLASGLAASGLAGLGAGPFLTSAAGVTVGRYTWDARSAT